MMMKYKLVLIFLLVFSFNNAQNTNKQKVKSTIIEFFEAFHRQDTTKLKSMSYGNIKMQSISINKQGKSQFSENDYNSFLKNISAIPKDKTFKEKLLDLDIKIDGNMANVWTPYEFYFDKKFSHCGVNSFQLLKENNVWKIIYLVDTRRLNNCKK